MASDSLRIDFPGLKKPEDVSSGAPRAGKGRQGGGFLSLYLVLASLRLGGKGRVPAFLLKGLLGLVLAYCLYAVLVLSSGNAKSDEVRATFTSLNPILRVGVSTLLMVDRDAVLTDAARTARTTAPGAWK